MNETYINKYIQDTSDNIKELEKKLSIMNEKLERLCKEYFGLLEKFEKQSGGE